MKVVKYKVRYAELPAKDIYNYVGPWDYRDDERRRFKRQYLYDQKKEWYDELEKDILINGYKNPILIVCGELAPGDWSSIPEFAKKKSLVCNILGGSRLFIGQKHSLLVPCIISDFLGRFSDCPDIFQPANIKSYFTNPPTDIKYTKYGLDLRTTP
jgi:hypothetical protein